MAIGQIAVLTPYSAQKNLIDRKMKEAKLKIKVASITESQGERQSTVVVCICTVTILCVYGMMSCCIR